MSSRNSLPSTRIGELVEGAARQLIIVMLGMPPDAVRGGVSHRSNRPPKNSDMRPAPEEV